MIAWITKHWFLILLLLLLIYALYTANRVLAFVVAIAATLFIWFNKLSNPVWLVFTALSWLISLLWGSPAVQSVYNFFNRPQSPTVSGLDGATGNPG